MIFFIFFIIFEYPLFQHKKSTLPKHTSLRRRLLFKHPQVLFIIFYSVLIKFLVFRNTNLSLGIITIKYNWHTRNSTLSLKLIFIIRKSIIFKLSLTLLRIVILLDFLSSIICCVEFLNFIIENFHNCLIITKLFCTLFLFLFFNFYLLHGSITSIVYSAYFCKHTLVI